MLLLFSFPFFSLSLLFLSSSFFFLSLSFSLKQRKTLQGPLRAAA